MHMLQVKGFQKHAATDFSSNLQQARGCFVTLNKHEQLRGCIGHLKALKPLYQCVIDNTISAASRDSRFPKVSASELSDIKIDVSVLTPAKPFQRKTYQELLDYLVPENEGHVGEANWTRRK